jgi:murein DD-endopeptidase MepM/ murein hydrolase activator NlpD
LILLLTLASLAAAQQPQDVGWRPALPRQGSLVVVLAPRAALGELAGEPLHFEGGQSFAAVPLAAADSVELHIVLRHDGIVEGNTVMLPVAVRSRDSSERLRAPDRFTPPPDSALLVRLDRERALSRGAARRAHDVPRLWTAPFIRPRPPSARATSPFAGGREVNGVWRSTHSGLDLAGRNGAPARVSNRGVVALVGDFFYGGVSVYVHHGAGLMTVYQHLSRALVAAGDTVERGQIIGRVGATGRVTGPHLHWQAQYGSIAFDPTDLLTLTSPPASSPD